MAGVRSLAAPLFAAQRQEIRLAENHIRFGLSQRRFIDDVRAGRHGPTYASLALHRSAYSRIIRQAIARLRVARRRARELNALIALAEVA